MSGMPSRRDDTRTLTHAVLEMAERVQLRGAHVVSTSGMRRGQIEAVFKLTNSLQQLDFDGLRLLGGRVLASLFFEPSTRTRLSFEAAMLRMGGTVIGDTTPHVSSSVAKEESLGDMLKVVSHYADVIVLRHPDAEAAVRAVEHAGVPVISAGSGLAHPTQALVDIYTIWCTLGRIDDLRVLVAGADLRYARTAHSLALALAVFGGKTYYVCPQDCLPSQEAMEDLRDAGADVEVVLDPTCGELEEMITMSDVVYLPGCNSLKDTELRTRFHRNLPKYHISLEVLQRAKKKGKHVYVMHPLPRAPGEMDTAIDNSDYQLYFKQVAYSVPIRMALLLALIG